MSDPESADMTAVCTFDDMLTCPFCGGSPRLQTVRDRSWWVECLVCGVETRSVFTMGDAIAQWNRRDVYIPRPLGSLLRLGALLCRRHMSPTGGFCHARYEDLDRIGLESGALVPGNLDSTGPELADGVRKMIADVLGPEGAEFSAPYQGGDQ